MSFYSLSRPPDGRIMCALCFEYMWLHEVFVDEEGQAWDVHPGLCARQCGADQRSEDHTSEEPQS